MFFSFPLNYTPPRRQPLRSTYHLDRPHPPGYSSISHDEYFGLEPRDLRDHQGVGTLVSTRDTITKV